MKRISDEWLTVHQNFMLLESVIFAEFIYTEDFMYTNIYTKDAHVWQREDALSVVFFRERRWVVLFCETWFSFSHKKELW